VTPEQRATLPDDLLSARHAIDCGAYWNTGLIDLAAERICELEEELLAERKAASTLRGGIVRHRGRRDFMGGKEQCDYDLWGLVDDVPWHRSIKGDG
jgi:hypothetical protein